MNEDEKTVATEVAEQEFSRFLELMGLAESCNEDELDADDRKTFLKHKGEIVRAIERGQLVVDDKGQGVFTPASGGKALTFREPTGADLKQMDRAREGRNQEKNNKVMASLTGVSESRFEEMPMRDLRVCNSILLLFF